MLQNAPKNNIFPKRMFWKSCMSTTLFSYFIIIFFFLDKNVLFWVWGWTLNDLTLERSDMFLKVCGLVFQ